MKGITLHLRLCAMMFLQFAVWGAWAVVIGGHMEHNLHFSGKQISYVFGTTAFGALLSPLIAGWIADRFMPSQVFTALAHLAGAVLLFIAWQQTTFWPLWISIFLYAMLYMPTIALTNGISFYHMKDAAKFGNIRVWGTIGWICVQWFLAAYLLHWEKLGQKAVHERDCLIIAAGAAILMGLYSLTLPDTPPTKEAKNPYAFVEALKLMVNRNFAVLMIISFFVAIELPFYYNLTYLFLTGKQELGGIGLEGSSAQFAMTLGQVGEVVLMVLLWPAIRYGGMRMTIFLGILAWPVRYAIFAIGHPIGLVIAAQTLHGICYAFFFEGGMIAVEKLSHKDIRASAQGLLVFATSGAGMLIGHFLSGQVHDFFKAGRTWMTVFGMRVPAMSPAEYHSWPSVFMVPIAVTIIGAIVFVVLFNERQFREDSVRIEQEDAAGVGPDGEWAAPAE